MDKETFSQQNNYKQDNSANVQEINELQCSNNIPFNNNETKDNIFNNISPKTIISKKGLIKLNSTSNADNNYIKKDNNVFINNQTTISNTNHKNNENISGNNKEQLSIYNLSQRTRMIFKRQIGN